MELMMPQYGRPDHFDHLFWYLGVYCKGWTPAEIKLDREVYLEEKMGFMDVKPIASVTRKPKKKKDQFDFSDDSEEDDQRKNALDDMRDKRSTIKLNLGIIDSEFAITFSASKEYKDYDKSAKVK